MQQPNPDNLMCFQIIRNDYQKPSTVAPEAASLAAHMRHPSFDALANSTPIEDSNSTEAQRILIVTSGQSAPPVKGVNRELS
jgi:hypothetical protein